MTKFQPLTSVQDVTPAVFAYAGTPEYAALPDWAKTNFTTGLRAMDADMAHEVYLALYGAREHLGPDGWLLCGQLAKFCADHFLNAEGKPVGMYDGNGHALAVVQVALREIGDQTGPDASTDPDLPELMKKWADPTAAPVPAPIPAAAA